MTGALVPGGRTLARRGWRSLVWSSPAVADQILSSGTQLLLVMLVARTSSAAQFGAISIAVLIHGFVLGAVRALVGDVTLIRCRRDGSDLGFEARTGLAITLVLSTAISMVLFVVGALVGGDVGRFISLFAVAAPFVHGQDALRSIAYGSRRVAEAALLDGVWLVVQVVISAGLLLSGRNSAGLLIAAWAAGAVASLGLGCRRGRLLPSRAGVRGWVSEDGRRAAGFVGDYLVSKGVVQTSFLLLAVIIPLAEFGSFRLAFVSVSPLANVTAGVRLLTLARLAEPGMDRTHASRTARRVVPLFVAFAAAYGAVVMLVPMSVGLEVFGSTWAEARSLVPVVVLGEALRLATFPAIDLLRVFESPGILVGTRATVSAVVAGAILGGGLVAGSLGAAWGTAAGMAAATVIWWGRVRSTGRATAA